MAGVLAAALTATGCSSATAPTTTPTVSASETSPRSLTQVEAQRLARLPYEVYRHIGLHFDSTLTTAKGSVRFDGDVNYRSGIGYATAIGDGAAFTLQWNSSIFAAWTASATQVEPPPDLPTGKPAGRPLAPAKSLSDALLSLLLQLGRDRPGNAREIRQQGGRFLRDAVVDGQPVEVLQGPRTSGSATATTDVDYWLGDSGRLVRVEASIDGNPPTEIDLSAAKYRPFLVTPVLRR
jgi:hypothetical protein